MHEKNAPSRCARDGAFCAPRHGCGSRWNCAAQRFPAARLRMLTRTGGTRGHHRLGWLGAPSLEGAVSAVGRAGTCSTVTRPHAAEHLPAPAHLGLRPVRGRAPAAVPPRPRRRLGLPVAAAGGRGGQRARVRRRGAHAGRTPSAAVPAAWRCCPRWRTGWTWACWSTSSPTTSAWRARGRPPGGGTCSSTGRSRGSRRTSTSTGTPAAAGSCCRSSATATTASIEVRPGRSARCATTSCGCRWRPARPTLEEQHYELVSWRRGDAELNYRRFFTVTTLAGVRVEEPEVFEASHRGDRALVRRRPRRRAAGRPPRRAARPGGLPRPAGQADRRRRTSWSRRSSSRASRCRPRGPPPAPPATTSWRWSTASSPTRPARLRSTEPRAGRLPSAGARDQARGRRRLAAGRGAPDRARAARHSDGR